MKTVSIPAQSTEIDALLDDAREDSLLVRTADGSEFVVTPVDDFDLELVRTRQNDKLMALLDERARQTACVSLEEVKRQLGLAQ
jgi:hypothetical protein